MYDKRLDLETVHVTHVCISKERNTTRIDTHLADVISNPLINWIYSNTREFSCIRLTEDTDGQVWGNSGFD